MRKIMIMGAGAQGSTIAKRMQEESSVEEIVCADYDMRAAEELEKSLSKVKAVQVDASEAANIVAAANGCGLIVNGLPPEFNMRVMDAALEAGASYLDMASAADENDDWINGVRIQLARDEEFKKAGLTALINCGSAPGIANVITREACEQLDSVDTIDINVYEGVWTTRFIPFWWSPETAFQDMADEPVVYENGEFKIVPPFNRPEWVDFRGLGKRLMCDHHHEETATMGLLADQYLKGAQNIYFRYGGPGCDLAKRFWEMGLLSSEPVEVDGVKIVPMRLISKLTPPAPKYEKEIKEVIDAGIDVEEGVFLVRVDGLKDGEKVRVDSYVNVPGLRESFERAGISHEAYLTGQCAWLFTKMLITGEVSQKGVFPPEVLEADPRAYFLKEAAKLDITVDQYVERRLS
jgi:saccharopine dehydrogenase-like NADP-dependent oxidoreductase